VSNKDLEIAKFASDLGSRNEELENAQNEISSLSSVVNSKAARIQELSTERADLKLSSSNNERSLVVADDQISRLKEQLQDLQKGKGNDTNVWEQQCGKKTPETEQVRQELSDLKITSDIETNRLEKDLGQKNSEMTDLQQRFADLGTANAECTAELRSNSRRKGGLQPTLGNLRRCLDLQRATITDRAEIERIKDRLRQSESDI